MLEVVFSIFVLCLSIVGIIEIFKIISISFFCQKEFDENIVTLIPVYGHREEIEMTLRNAITNAKWFGCTKNRQIICLNLGSDAETYKICKIFSEEYDSIELYSLEEFDSVMRQSSVQVG